MWVKTIGVWGDSITYGAGDSESLGWVGRLRRRIEHDHATSIYNFGVCGDTTRELLKRFKIEADSVEPELVLIAIGTNNTVFRDGREENREVPLEECRANLEKILTIAQGRTKHIFVIGFTIANDPLVQPIPWSTTKKSYKTEILRGYDQTLREIAKDNGVTFIDLWDVLTTDDLSDGLHPNAQGYEKIYQNIHAAIRSHLG